MFPVGFEPTISAGERPKTCALDRAATGTGFYQYYHSKLFLLQETNYYVSEEFYVRQVSQL